LSVPKLGVVFGGLELIIKRKLDRVWGDWCSGPAFPVGYWKEGWTIENWWAFGKVIPSVVGKFKFRRKNAKIKFLTIFLKHVKILGFFLKKMGFLLAKKLLFFEKFSVC
jgi:hypothetical protein